MENEHAFQSDQYPLVESSEAYLEILKDQLRQPNNQTMILEFENENVSIHCGLN